MSKYRHALPQLGDGLFLTDGGLETTMIFHEGTDLPFFASFDLLRTRDGERRLANYFRRHAGLAVDRGLGFILESATWRASPDWGSKLGYSAHALDAVNRQAIEMLLALREELETPSSPMVVSGCVGPRGDGYNPDSFMTAGQARDYHGRQIAIYADAGADMASAMTMTYPDEAIGVVDAARENGLPVSISFTVETDGRLPSGHSLFDAMRRTDEATGGYAAYYMINCAHPEHFEHVLDADADVVARVRGIRANASRLSHAQLDNATELDDGDPEEFGDDYARLLRRLPHLRVLGGCCGTDHRHIASIAAHCH